MTNELDKYLAHLPARKGRSLDSSNSKRSTQLDRPLPGLKGPRGLSLKSKSTMDRPHQPLPNFAQDASVADLSRKMDLKLSMDSPPLSEEAPQYTDNDTCAHNDASNKQGNSYTPDYDSTLEQTGQNNNKATKGDVSPPSSIDQQPKEIPTFSFGTNSTPPIKRLSEEMPPIPTFSFGTDPIPTFSFGNDDSCNYEKEVLNLAIGLKCGGCDKMISGMAITAAGHRWHADCFKCQHCHQDLEHVAFYEKDGLPYCALDYHELFTTRCQYCHTPIEEKSIHALGKYYHVGHFFCRECGKPFDEDSTFMEHDGHPYCEKDYLAKFAQKCKGCKEDISGNFLEALDGKWHLTCFVCVDCGKAFDSNIFYVRNNLPYCEQHSRRIKRSI